MLSDIRFQGYNASYLKRDLAAGLIVGIVAIPLGMAFAIASGVRPEYGIYTVILAGLLVSLLGGSKFQIAGPTGAFVPILFAIVMEHGYENLLIAGFMAGIMLVLLGLFKLGSLMRYIPRPVTIGFTTGIAVIIFSGQIAHFLGLRNVKKKEAFHENMREIAVHIETVNWYSVGTAVICLAVLLMTSRLTTKVPPALAGLIAATLAAVLFFRGKIDTIGSTYGAIPTGLPTFKLPALSWDLVVDLLPAAFVIAMLGGIESLLSAMVADRMGGDKHNSNKELIGQGIANMVTPLFGGIPATGAIARTATNIKNGSASPLSGIIHALVVLVVLLVFAPYASHIPLAAMAPILMFVAWNMSERREFMHVLKTRTGDSVVLVVTFLLTVFADLTTAVGAGLVLAAVLFIKRMSGTLKLEGVLPDPQDKLVKPAQAGKERSCPQIAIFTVEGPLFFGTSSAFLETIKDKLAAGGPQPILLLRMGKVSDMDTTGEAALADIAEEVKARGGTLLLTGITPAVRPILDSSGLSAKIGEERLFRRTGEAIAYALRRVSPARCSGCRQFTFDECTELSKPAPAAVRPDRAGVLQG
ncbi:SulP family inorganic anion transporter [Paenibacillus caseinilyticus]|uniref:SulP family sulfate permease n=1 Tax=Paenibacillus mucilaginosus K02 TaxID=997761 RepID=I0BNH7_9BACL|nr:sulfate permease [Paenibacillus mucilaginosus]AFH63924.1 SulP family sulfate permease [Paenibacillus mucilaginosus K02]